MIQQAKNGYEVQISEISKKQYIVSRNKKGEHGFVYHNEQSAIDKFNELLNEEKYDANYVFVSIQNVTTLITEGEGDE